MDSACSDESTATKHPSRCGESVLSAVREATVRDRPGVDVSTMSFPPAFEGVLVERFPAFHDNRGSMIPTLDTRRVFWNEPVVYAYALTVRPGVIKGWGMHKVQTDRYCVLSGRVRVVLFDARENSADRGRFSEVWFTDETPGLLRIPPGIWHADQNWGSSDALIVNYPTHPYNPANPDKFRIDPHANIIPFDWRLKDG